MDFPGGLDLFSGKREVARSLACYRAPWVLAFELDRGADQDLDSPLRQKLGRLIDLGAFKIIGGAPVCSSFSRAVRPPVRSASCPAGFPGLSPGMFGLRGQLAEPVDLQLARQSCPLGPALLV